MSSSRPQISLVLAGALFFGIVAPYITVVVPVLPLLLLAYIGMNNAMLPFVLPLAIGGVPALVAGMLYGVIGSRLVDTKRRPALAALLSAGSFVVWFVLLAVLGSGLQSHLDLWVLLVAAFLLSAFAAIGGYLTSIAFHWCVRRSGYWCQTRSL